VKYITDVRNAKFPFTIDKKGVPYL
jgi:hypothetical protein